MTDKEYGRFWQGVRLLTAFLMGLGIGGLIVSIRYDVDIRTDQLELKDQVAEVMADKPVIEDIVQTLLSLVEQVKAERESLEEIKILLSKGE